MRWRHTRTQGTAPWGRGRLALTLCALGLGAVVLLAGLGYGIYTAVVSDGDQQLTGEDVADLPAGQERRDAIASLPMPDVAPQDARRGVPASSPAPVLDVPAPTGLGPVSVPTGFPRTPQGALGQLAAITQTVLQSLSIQAAHDVHTAWSEPGAVPAEQWQLVKNLQAFLGSKAGPHLQEPTTSLRVTPVGAQIKGTDGQDWVLACVLFEVTATVVDQETIAYGYCEAMAWSSQGRWVLAAGPQAAAAPSTWPGTDLAREVGWRTWHEVAS